VEKKGEIKMRFLKIAALTALVAFGGSMEAAGGIDDPARAS
jgi:hypothetical protein